MKMPQSSPTTPAPMRTNWYASRTASPGKDPLRILGKKAFFSHLQPLIQQGRAGKGTGMLFSQFCQVRLFIIWLLVLVHGEKELQVKDIRQCPGAVFRGMGRHNSSCSSRVYLAPSSRIKAVCRQTWFENQGNISLYH